MTRETKIGLLLGLGVILLIGIIISDQLSQVQQDPADFTGFASESQRSIDSSDANPATNYPAMSPGFAPTGVPAENTDIPGGFFIPDGLQQPGAQRRADAGNPAGTPTVTPPTAYNVQPAPAAAADSAGPAVTTLRIGDEPIQPPHTLHTPVDPAATTAGNTPVAEQPRTATADSSVIRHTVAQGESLSKLAIRYYGNADYWRAIALANPGKVARDGGVNIGVTLDIPKRDNVLNSRTVTAYQSETARPVDIRSAATPNTVTVKAGDTLSELASKHLGSAGKWDELLEANKDRLDSPEELKVGMKLRIPGTAASTPVVNTTHSARSSKSYTIRSGDNLTEIAERTLGDGGRWRDVYEANRDKLKSPDRLEVGQTLRIPN